MSGAILKSVSETAALLKSFNSVIVSAHISPDADAIGSSAGLALGLARLGKKAAVYLYDPVIEKMRPLVGDAPIVNQLPNVSVDAVVVVDTASRRRVGEDGDGLFKLGKTVVNIDHHISNDNWGDHNYIDSAAAASAIIVYELLSELGNGFDTRISNLLYAGLSDDTGQFRYSNTDKRSLTTAAALVEIGAEPHIVANAMYYSVPTRVQRLRALALAGMQIELGGRAAIVVCTKEMLSEAGAKDEDTDGLIDEARAVEGTDCAILIRELSQGWKISLRSKRLDFDVNRIAGIFGGGGHAAAAGCKIGGSLEQVQAALLGEVKQALEQLAKN